MIAVLATPALAGGKQPLKPAPVAKLDKLAAPLAKLETSRLELPKLDGVQGDVPVELKPESKKLVESYDLGKTSFGNSYDVLKPGRRSALPAEASS